MRFTQEQFDQAFADHYCQDLPGGGLDIVGRDQLAEWFKQVTYDESTDTFAVVSYGGSHLTFRRLTLEDVA